VKAMDHLELDNPVWSALSGPHRGLSLRHADLLWYPSSIAPFAAIPAAGVTPDLESAYRHGLAEQVYFVGACPDSLPDGWRVISRSHILQLFPTLEVPEAGEDAGAVLGEKDRSAMRALTQIAFPDFFRERTAELGVYLGVYHGAQLIAMAGAGGIAGNQRRVHAPGFWRQRARTPVDACALEPPPAARSGVFFTCQRRQCRRATPVRLHGIQGAFEIADVQSRAKRQSSVTASEPRCALCQLPLRYPYLGMARKCVVKQTFLGSMTRLD
jgi:hypothetical protein